METWVVPNEEPSLLEDPCIDALASPSGDAPIDWGILIVVALPRKVRP